MSSGRQWNATGGRHLEKNPHTNSFQDFKTIMAKLDAQLVKEEAMRKAKRG